MPREMMWKTGKNLEQYKKLQDSCIEAIPVSSDKNTQDKLEKLRTFFGVSSNAEVISCALDIAEIVAEYSEPLPENAPCVVLQNPNNGDYCYLNPLPN